MINIIPIKEGLFKRDFTKKELKKLEVGNWCYANDLTLISKLLSISEKDRPIKNQRIFIKNVLEFLNYLEYNCVDGKKSLYIHTSIFEQYFGKNHTTIYKNILSELEVITKIPVDGVWYVPGERCMKYRIHNKYLELDELCLVILDSKTDKYVRSISVNESCNGLDHRYIDTIDKLEINIIPAIKDEMKYCSDNDLSDYVLRNRISRIFYTKHKRFIKRGVKQNRIYHSFSNVSKVSREHFNINFNEIDIVNSQPLLLVAYLKDNNLDVSDIYKDDCENGVLYQNFYDLYPKNNDIRKKVKQGIYKNIFFGFNQRSILNKRFKELYPETWNSLLEISKSEFSLASRLQNLEAELFNNLIPKKSNKFFTLFDAIYFNNSNDIPFLRKSIKDFFNSKGVKVKTKIK